MEGSSRASRAALAQWLADQPADGLDQLATDLFGVTDLLATEPQLRRALAEPASPPGAKQALVTALLAGKVSAPAQDAVALAAAQRWSSPRHLPDALDSLASEALLAAADADGTLDEVEDELFRFGRVLGREPALELALADPTAPPDRNAHLLHRLLDGKASDRTTRLLERIVSNSRGRELQRAIEELGELAAARRQRLIADVEVAAELDAAQAEALRVALGRVYSADITLQVAVVPGLLGGVRVRVGQELIDGSVLRRLAEARILLAR